MSGTSEPRAPDPADWVAVTRATNGEAAAIEELLARHAPALHGYVARRGGGLPSGKESASDVVQSVCREVLERLRDGRLRFQGEPQFREWLYRAALMKLMNRRRYWTSARRDADLERRDSVVDHVAGRGPSPSAELVALEELERFERAFAELSDDQRALIDAFYGERRTHAEIAAERGISEAYSRTLLSRALARLARFGVAAPS